MADLRYKLKTASFRNQSLQDILKSCSKAVELITVERYFGKVHNTKITLKMNHGDNVPLQERYYDRVHFYNRLNIRTVIPSNFVSSGDLEQDIEELNLLGCDFTEDDVELVGNSIVAKVDSLGYHNYAESSTGVDHAYVNDIDGQVDHLIINGVNFVLNQLESPRQDLFAAGLGVYHTGDSVGCWELSRYQNLTNQPMEIELYTSVNNFGYGLTYLTSQENQTVEGTNDGTMNLEEGYTKITFTLAPNQTELNFSPDRVIFNANTYNGYPRRNSNNEEYHYRFWVDDQVVMNATTGNNYFTIVDNDGLGQLSIALGLKGVSITGYYWYNDNPNQVNISCGVPVGVAKKIKVSQLGNIDLQTHAGIIGANVSGNSINIVTDTPNEFTVEAYAYDPLDLE